MKTIEPASLSRQQGLSLIELMVALIISLLVALGILQIFSATSATFRMQEGLSRVQESGRYAIQTLQHELRMVGYMGCGSDTERETQASFVNHLASYSATIPGGDAVDQKYRFQRPIEAYSADHLSADLTALDLKAVAGTDVLVLRTVSEESAPVISITPDADHYGLVVTASGADTQFPEAKGEKVLYALESCRSADVFEGTLTSGPAKITVAGKTGLNVYLDPTVTDCGGDAGCPWDFRISNVFLNAPLDAAGTSTLQLNAEIHRAEYTLLYIRPNPNLIPSLYMRRLQRNGAALEDDPQELAEGIENLQLRFGVDTGDDGQVDAYKTAAEVASGATTDVAIDAAWRNVLSVRVGLLVRSASRAGVSGKIGDDARTFTVLGTKFTPPDDGNMRQVYETTIALRNRIFNS